MFLPSVKKVLLAKWWVSQNLNGLDQRLADLLESHAVIEEPLHEQEVDEIEEGGVGRSRGSPAVDHWPLMPHLLGADVVVALEPTPHSRSLETYQASGLRC